MYGTKFLARYMRSIVFPCANYRRPSVYNQTLWLCEFHFHVYMSKVIMHAWRCSVDWQRVYFAHKHGRSWVFINIYARSMLLSRFFPSESQFSISGRLKFNGVKFRRFLAWITRKFREWRRRRPTRPDEGRDEANSAAQIFVLETRRSDR